MNKLRGIDQLHKAQQQHAALKKGRGETLKDAQKRRITLPKVAAKK